MHFLKNGTKLVVVALLFVSVSCATSNNTKNPENMTLSDYINKLDGVRITGSGRYAKVMVSSQKMSGMRFKQGWGGKATGGTSESRKHPPLFIVDGQKVGRDYQRVRDIILGRKLKSVKLLQKNLAYSQYRKESYYGVLEIYTQKSNSKNGN